MGEILEALSDPERAKTFATRIGGIVRDVKKVDERVRNNGWRLTTRQLRSRQTRATAGVAPYGPYISH